MFSFAFPTFILSLALVAFADPTPSEPSPGNVFKEGSSITATWTPDTNTPSPWKTMNIELMTGDNFHMVHLTTVGTVDGTASPGTFTFPCPAVTIHAPIYFLQFSSDATHVLWTGRFAIADASGATVPAPNTTQSNGQAIPWGTGALVDPSKATPPPSYFPGGSSNASSVAPVSSAGSSAASSNTPSSGTPSSTPSANTPLAVVPSGTTNTTSGTPTDSLGPANTGSSAKSSGSNSGGALVLSMVSTRAAHAGVAMAVIAGTMTFLM